MNDEIVTSRYDKRDDFPFKIVNFPDLSGNIPRDGSYGAFIAQTLRYAKACAKYTHFMDRTLTLKQLVKQLFNETILLLKTSKMDSRIRSAAKHDPPTGKHKLG